MRSLALSAVCALSSCLLLPVASTLGADAAEVRPLSGPWSGGKFTFASRENKTRRSLSGIACPGIGGTGGGKCLVVFDEGTMAHFVDLSSTGYTVDNTPVRLRSTDDELDAEAAAVDENYYYVTGSHSAKRNSCESNEASRHVVRFAYDPATGLAKRDKDGGLVDYLDKDSLWGLMASQPNLKDYVGERKCLGTEPPEDAPEMKGQRGVNIEGLAASGGFLHFDFRGPAIDGTAPILSVNAKALFEALAPDGAVTFLNIGKGRGVRDLSAIKGGILVLAGPDDDKANKDVKWTVGVWDGVPSRTPDYKELATLVTDDVKLRDCDKELKLEAMAVIEDLPTRLTLVIMSDGMCDGGPLTFEIPRP